MTQLQAAIRDEIEQVHRFFVDWFAGTAPRDASAPFFARFDPGFFYVTPDGQRLALADLDAMLAAGHGTNPDFRIAVRDVTVRHAGPDYVLATYTEWQAGARASARENARITTALFTAAPFKWRHIHETWLPEADRAAGAFPAA